MFYDQLIDYICYRDRLGSTLNIYTITLFFHNSIERVIITVCVIRRQHTPSMALMNVLINSSPILHVTKVIIHN